MLVHLPELRDILSNVSQLSAAEKLVLVHPPEPRNILSSVSHLSAADELMLVHPLDVKVRQM
jgi:hypothetical protein